MLAVALILVALIIIAIVVPISVACRHKPESLITSISVNIKMEMLLIFLIV